MKATQRTGAQAALALAMVGALLDAPSARADLLVYEGFDYTPDEILTGKGGALGTTGTWQTHDFITGDGKTQDWFVHVEGKTSGVGLSNANPSIEPSGLHRWDGTVANLLTSGGYAGLWGADDWNDDDPFNGEPGRTLDASIGLDPSVTATFQKGTTTWFSYVAVRGWDRNEETPSLIIATDPTPNDSRAASLIEGGSGFGTGGGPPRGVRTHIYPMYFEGGSPYTLNGQVTAWNDDAKAPDVDSRMDWQELDVDGYFGAVNIVVGKIEWDVDTGGEDIISVARFLEADTLSEAAFEALIAAQPNLSSANWDANKPDLDQSEFDTLSIAGLKFFVDEVRIATTFEEAISGGVAPYLPPQLIITEAEGNLTIEWESEDGMLYNLRSAVEPSAADPVDWSIVGDKMELVATPPTNRVTIPLPADPVRFFVVEEFPPPPPPPLFEENFDLLVGLAIPEGWSTAAGATAWEVGDPISGSFTGPIEAESVPNCAGTAILADYAPSTLYSLITPAVAIPAGGGTLNFELFIDTDGFGDVGTLRILDADNGDALLEEMNPPGPLEGFGGDWSRESFALPVVANGANIKIEFRFVSNDNGQEFAGFYIDDVVIEQN